MSESPEGFNFDNLRLDLIDEVNCWARTQSDNPDTVDFSLGGENNLTLPRPLNIQISQDSVASRQARVIWKNKADSDQAVFYSVQGNVLAIHEGSISRQDERRQILAVHESRQNGERIVSFEENLAFPAAAVSSSSASHQRYPVSLILRYTRRHLQGVMCKLYVRSINQAINGSTEVKLSLTAGGNDIDSELIEFRDDPDTRAHYATSFTDLQPGQILRSREVEPNLPNGMRPVPLRLRLERDSIEKGGYYGTLAILQPPANIVLSQRRIHRQDQAVVSAHGASADTPRTHPPLVDLLDRESLVLGSLGFIARDLLISLTSAGIRSKLGRILQKNLPVPQTSKAP